MPRYEKGVLDTGCGDIGVDSPNSFSSSCCCSCCPQQYKVWVKQSAEMSFLYGNHVTKSGLARMTENTPQYAGVVVYNLQGIPLGFGVAAQSTDHCQSLDPTGNVVLHQADIGDYLRGLEDDMF